MVTLFYGVLQYVLFIYVREILYLYLPVVEYKYHMYEHNVNVYLICVLYIILVAVFTLDDKQITRTNIDSAS